MSPRPASVRDCWRPQWNTVAAYLVERGAKVTISGRRPETVGALATELGDRCRAVISDVTEAGERARLLEAAVEHGGGLPRRAGSKGDDQWTPTRNGWRVSD